MLWNMARFASPVYAAPEPSPTVRTTAAADSAEAEAEAEALNGTVGGVKFPLDSLSVSAGSASASADSSGGGGGGGSGGGGGGAASARVADKAAVSGVDPTRPVRFYEYPGCKAVRDAGKIKQTILRYAKPHLNSSQVWYCDQYWGVGTEDDVLRLWVARFLRRSDTEILNCLSYLIRSEGALSAVVCSKVLGDDSSAGRWFVAGRGVRSGSEVRYGTA